MTDHTAPVAEQETVAALSDRLRSMHITLLFIAVLLCVMLGVNLVILAAD